MKCEAHFEWDESKNKLNVAKHGLDFAMAQFVFSDERRIVYQDIAHSGSENRFYCIGALSSGIATVRFVYRNGKIRIIGAGFWRKGKKLYEK
jgi:uncharacterized DUF497 family protein